MVITSEAEHSMESDELRALMQQRLTESGEIDKLRDHLLQRLNECGWHDQIRLEARKYVELHGDNMNLADIDVKSLISDPAAKSAVKIPQASVDAMVESLTPKARAAVPDSVKRELLAKIKEFLFKQTA